MYLRAGTEETSSNAAALDLLACGNPAELPGDAHRHGCSVSQGNRSAGLRQATAKPSAGSNARSSKNRPGLHSNLLRITCQPMQKPAAMRGGPLHEKADTLQTRLQILRANGLFASLPSRALETLALAMKQRQAAPAEAIFLQADEGSALFAILAGQVRIVIGGADGREHVLRVLGAGEMFGEIAVLDGGARSADALAVTRCRLLLLERHNLLALIASEPALAIGLIKILCGRLRDTTTQVEALVFHRLSERLASVLLNLTKARTSASIDVTQTELGRLTGVTRESVNKQLREWQTAGLIALRPGRVCITDADGLKRCCRDVQ